MRIVVDTHIIFWNILHPNKLSSKVASILDAASIIFLPAIALLELEWLFRKVNEYSSFEYFYQNLANQKKYVLYPLHEGVFEEYLKVGNTLEMHDRAIVATAKYLDVELLSKDLQIRKFYPKVIW